MAIQMSLLTLTAFISSLVSVGHASAYYIKEPRSCKQILALHPTAKNGFYYIKTTRGKLQVYCEMVLNGGGFTFLPRMAVSHLKSHDLKYLHTEHDKVLLRIQRADGRQSATLLSQLPHHYQNSHFTVMLNHHGELRKPVNWGHLGRAFYLGFITSRHYPKKGRILGFVSNGVKVQYKDCGITPNDYFVFYENAKELTPSNYHLSNPVYERQGVAVDWRKTGKVINSLRNLPIDYFFLTELHFGGCGTYTSSDRWKDAIGTAIGLK